MALVVSRDSRDCAGLIVKALIGDMPSQPRHPKNAGSTQVVNALPANSLLPLTRF